METLWVIFDGDDDLEGVYRTLEGFVEHISSQLRRVRATSIYWKPNEYGDGMSDTAYIVIDRPTDAPVTSPWKATRYRAERQTVIG
jgi:hypothetical protein